MDKLEEMVYRMARKRIKRKRALIKEAGVFVAVSLFLFILNVVTVPEYLWFLWAVGPWGLVLFFRGVSLWSSSYIDEWEEKAMESEIERYKNSMLRSHHVSDEEDYLEIDPLPRSKKKWNEQDLV
jgi:hypothetical protein